MSQVLAAPEEVLNHEILHEMGWRARLTLAFSNRQNRTCMTDVDHIGPLRVQRPFYPEGDCCHVYILHPPGGIVGGDILNIDVNCKESSQVLITTPGATKFYRSNGANALLQQNIMVAENSSLEWFPQENILFPGARAKINSTITLMPGAKFFGWEINCLGRPVNEEQFDHGEIDAKLNVVKNQQLLLIERFRVNQTNQLQAASGLRGFPMNGILLCSPCNDSHVDIARRAINQLSTDFPVAVTLLDDLLVMRCLGSRTDKIQKIMIAIWRDLRPLILNRLVNIPRIWAT